MISGRIFRDSIISAANNMANNSNIINELNVFPVPDGDTGTNMSTTIMASKKVMLQLDNNCTVSDVASMNSSALLRAARGNSGVILSLIFRGFNKVLSKNTSMTALDFAHAITEGINNAYKAVMKPTEGTILTVCKMAADKALDICKKSKDFLFMFNEVLYEAKKTLEKTPEMLPVLKKAGVVDSGGKGFVCLLEGMHSVFSGNGIIELIDKPEQTNIPSVTAFGNGADIDPNITNGYCTEFIVNKNNDVENEHVMKFRAFLESSGDSVVLVDDEEIIKVHIHTDDPGKALSEGRKYGFLTNLKIENMLEQYKQMIETGKSSYHPKNDKVIYKSDTANINKRFKYVKPTGENKFGFVAVSDGKGLHFLFEELGVNAVISGGQTMNPSTDDILNAVSSVDAEVVFVLPNNKNIILAAEQVVDLSDRKVMVLQTTTIPQGISAMLNFDTDCDLSTNEASMTNAINNVSTGLITFSARNSEYDGHKIKKGDILALSNGKLQFTETDLDRALNKLAKIMIKKDSEFLNIISGEDISKEKAMKMVSDLEMKVPETVEVSYIDGGQSLYPFIISVE